MNMRAKTSQANADAAKVVDVAEIPGVPLADPVEAAPVGLRRSAEQAQQVEGGFQAWTEAEYSKAEYKWSACGVPGAPGEVVARVDGAERFTATLSHDSWTQIQGIAMERAGAASRLGLINTQQCLGMALVMLEEARFLGGAELAARAKELIAQQPEANFREGVAIKMELSILKLVRDEAELTGSVHYIQKGREKAKAFLKDAVLLAREPNGSQVDSWYLKKNGSLWQESDMGLNGPRYSLKNVNPLKDPAAVPDHIKFLAVQTLTEGMLPPANTWKALPGGFMVERGNTLTTPFWVYRAYELTEAPNKTHSTITTLPDGRWVGRVGTRQLTPELDALPYGDKRIAAVDAWHKDQYLESHRIIRQAFPEASFGKTWDAEIEMMFKQD